MQPAAPPASSPTPAPRAALTPTTPRAAGSSAPPAAAGVRQPAPRMAVAGQMQRLPLQLQQTQVRVGGLKAMGRLFAQTKSLVDIFVRLMDDNARSESESKYLVDVLW